MEFRKEILSGLESMRMEELRGVWDLLERVEARRIVRENRKRRPRKKEELVEALQKRLESLNEEDWKVFESLFRRVHILNLLEETWRELEEKKGERITIRELVETSRKKIQNVPELRKTLKEMTKKELQDAIKSFTRMRLLRALESSLEEL